LLLAIGALIAVPNVVSLALPVGGVNFRYAVGYTAISLASGVLIVLVLPLERLRGAGAVVARVGRDSYGIYLWHGPLYLIGGGLPKAHIGVFDPLRAAALLAGWLDNAWDRYECRGRMAAAPLARSSLPKSPRVRARQAYCF
jgi:peptidoglycan/LPS O-acetylase OafA/YrhL